jgi:hypothetical protein
MRSLLSLRTATALMLILATTAIGAHLLLRGPSSDEREVRRVFAEFVAALCEGRHAELRWLVTEECVPYVAHMQELERAKDKQPLELLELEIEGSRATLAVRDPNPDAAAPGGDFVMRREDGRWRVDLIATAGKSARQRQLPGGGFRVTQTGLDPKTRFEAARAMEARYRRMEAEQETPGQKRREPR